jgi:hypothetical protein
MPTRRITTLGFFDRSGNGFALRIDFARLFGRTGGTLVPLAEFGMLDFDDLGTGKLGGPVTPVARLLLFVFRGGSSGVFFLGQGGKNSFEFL